MIKKFNEITGHRDSDGNWVDEAIGDKIRNRLTPFWTLSEVLNKKNIDFALSSSEMIDIIKELAEKCESNKSVILDLIKELEK